MNRKKILSFAVLPALALVMLGAGQASAHGWFGLGGNADPKEVAQVHNEMFAGQAEMLGIGVDEVKNAWAQGKTLQELATEKGISEQQLQQKMADARKQQMKERLQVLVDQGVITQSQADQRLQVVEQKFQTGKLGGKARFKMGMMGMGL